MRIFDHVQAANLPTAGILCLDTIKSMLYHFCKVYGAFSPSCRRPYAVFLGDPVSVKNIFFAGDFRGGIFFERIFWVWESPEKSTGTRLWYGKIFFAGKF